jgi:hypothetical protein
MNQELETLETLIYTSEIKDPELQEVARLITNCIQDLYSRIQVLEDNQPDAK